MLKDFLEKEIDRLEKSLLPEDKVIMWNRGGNSEVVSLEQKQGFNHAKKSQIMYLKAQLWKINNPETKDYKLRTNDEGKTFY